MFKKKITVYMAPLLLFLILELIFFKVNYFYLPIIAAFVLILPALKIVIKEKFWSRNFFWLCLLPILLLANTIGLIFLISSGNLRHLVVFLFCLIFGVYLENIFVYYYQPAEYLPFSMENFSNLLVLLIFFLLVLNLNAFSVFLNLGLWLLSLIFLFVLVLLVLQAFWANKFFDKIKYIYLFIVCILLSEFYWALSYLPTNFYVSSIIITIFFYFIWGLVRARLAEKKDKKIFWRYLVSSAVLLAIVILTTPWI